MRVFKHVITRKQRTRLQNHALLLQSTLVPEISQKYFLVISKGKAMQLWIYGHIIIFKELQNHYGLKFLYKSSVGAYLYLKSIPT